MAVISRLLKIIFNNEFAAKNFLKIDENLIDQIWCSVFQQNKKVLLR